LDYDNFEFVVRRSKSEKVIVLHVNDFFGWRDGIVMVINLCSDGVAVHASNTMKGNSPVDPFKHNKMKLTIILL
jgi:hypothetical protein